MSGRASPLFPEGAASKAAGIALPCDVPTVTTFVVDVLASYVQPQLLVIPHYHCIVSHRPQEAERMQ